MHHINLKEVDRDGAIQEAAEAVAGDTRLNFLRKAGIAGGAAVSGGAVLSALIPGVAMAGSGFSRPPASFGAGDIGILNFALTLEYLERAFYDEATAKGKITNHRLKKFLKTVTLDERKHVAFLEGALGSKAVAKPNFDFKGIPGHEAQFAATAQVLENTGVHAYLGQVGNIKNPAYVLAAATIVTIEARHSGAIGVINSSGGGIAPSGPFDKPLGGKTIFDAVIDTGFIV